MKDFLESAVTFKVNALLAGSLTISSALLGFGGKIAIDAAKTEQIQIELKQTNIELKDIKSHVYELERSIVRTEEQGRLQLQLLDKILDRK